MSKTQVITGAERRRRFSDEEKARFIAEVADSTVAAVSRKYGITPSLLHLWRKRFPPKSFALVEVKPDGVLTGKAPIERQLAPVAANTIRVMIRDRVTVEFPLTVDPCAIAMFIKTLEG